MGASCPEHTHDDAQVSVHFAGGSQPYLERLDVDLFPSRMPHTGRWQPGTEVVVFQLAPVARCVSDTKNPTLQVDRGGIE